MSVRLLILGCSRRKMPGAGDLKAVDRYDGPPFRVLRWGGVPIQMDTRHEDWSREEQVQADLQRQPHLFLRLVENTLTVAESLRDNYFRNTAALVSALRRAVERPGVTLNRPPIPRAFSVDDADWAEAQGEVVTFLDGGVGQAEIGGRVPILLRVGSYGVRTGERRLPSASSSGITRSS